MKELRSKKTNRVTMYSDEDYVKIVKSSKGEEILRRFVVTDITTKPIVPSLKIKNDKK